ncbi:hypothetical protein JN080_04055 [Bacillus sp. EB600]|nr:hypothetical protein [Bacillus sp. EB600]
MAVIILFQWPKMKQHPKKDKWAFFMLLLIGWMLSMFDLPNMPGPLTWIEELFKPVGQFMEKK